MKEGNALQHMPSAAAGAVERMSPAQAAAWGLAIPTLIAPAQLLGGTIDGAIDGDTMGGLREGAGAAAGGIAGGALGGLAGLAAHRMGAGPDGVLAAGAIPSIGGTYLGAMMNKRDRSHQG